VATTLQELIDLCVEYDGRHRATAAEEAAKKPARPAPVASSSRPAASSSSASRPAASFSAPRPAAAPVAHPTDSNSGHYGSTPMNLSSAERLQIPNERNGSLPPERGHGCHQLRHPERAGGSISLLDSDERPEVDVVAFGQRYSREQNVCVYRDECWEAVFTDRVSAE
jgi:hypothetical protein